MQREPVQQRTVSSWKNICSPELCTAGTFFSLSQNTCDLFILFCMGQFLGKNCVRGDGLCSTRKCCWNQWAEISNVLVYSHGAGSWQQPGVQPGPPLLPLAYPAQLVFAQPAHGHFSVSPAPSFHES